MHGKERKVKLFIAPQNIGSDATREQTEKVIELLCKKGWNVTYGIGRNVATEVSEFGREEQIQDAFSEDFMACIAEVESGETFGKTE